MEIPREFRSLFRTSPVLDLIGPLYCRGEGVDLVVGLRVGAKHCNARGTVHGGILATLADVALGYTIAFSSTPPASLATNFEAHVDVQKRGSRLSFANCYITVNGQRIARASAVFLVTGQLDASAPA